MFDFDVITGPSPTTEPSCQRPPAPPKEAPAAPETQAPKPGEEPSAAAAAA